MFASCKTTRLDTVARITAGQSSPTDDEFTNEGVPFIKAGNLEDLKLGNIQEKDCNLVNDATVKKNKLKLQPAGSTLVAKSGMSCNSGHIYVLNADAYIVSHLACITPNANVPPNFIKWFFIVNGTKELIKDAGYPSIQLGQFAEMEVPCAKDEEMKLFDRIAIQSDKSKFVVSNRNLSGRNVSQ